MRESHLSAALTATVTAGGTEQVMNICNGQFASTMQLPRDQQVQPESWQPVG